MRVQRGIRVATLFVFLVGIACAAGCAGSSDSAAASKKSNTIAIKTLLDDSSKYNDKTVRIEGTVENSMSAFGKGSYDVDDGTGMLTVITSDADAPREGARVTVEGEFESLFTIGDAAGAVLKEMKRTMRE
ncbi:MAG: hypothetical protein ACKVU1_11675 [bacterium]